MKENQFARLNYEKWESYYALTSRFSSIAPDRIAQIYLDLTTDLAFSQTNFPDSPLTIYLERLALHFHQRIYARRPHRWREFLRYFTHDIPMAFYESRRELKLSLFVFFIATIVGVTSQWCDADFANYILGNAYVETTRENFASGKPMNVYADTHPLSMFISIWWNNTRIDLTTFVAGIASLPVAFLIVIYNGVMFGCFETFLSQEGALLHALFTVNLHGSLEIPTIITSGAAAFALATGWMYPGNRTRRVALRQGAERGVKIMLGTLPLTFLAALIESFLTRYYDTPLAARIIFVIAGILFSIYFIIFLPQRIARHDSSLRRTP